MQPPTITDGKRRQLLARRHLLTPSARTDDVVAIARSLVALHSTDPVSVYLSVLARMRNPDLVAVAEALYGDRSLIRHHAMRRTLWVAPPETICVMHRACTRKIAAVERRKTEAFLAASGVGDPGPWLEDAQEQVCRVLAEHGPVSAREIGVLLPAVARPLALSTGKSYAGVQGAHSRVVTGLGFEGVAVRTKPSGTWINGQYAWARMQDWAPALHTSMQSGEVQQAQGELARMWLARFGPGTERDLSWWSGWTLGDTRAALTACGAEPMTIDTGQGWALPADGASSSESDHGAADAEPWVALLPGLDPSIMGWKERGFAVPVGGEAAWDTNGNAGPTVWVDGQVVGAWGQTKTGEIRLHYFVDVPAARRRHVQARADEVRAWLGETRISWR
ncbi:MAG: winged helix DNA-binding domain-containing protein, partial [Ornithinimicrobium sp.]